MEKQAEHQLIKTISAYTQNLKHISNEIVELFILESKLIGKKLIILAGSLFAIALFIASTWILLMVSVVLTLMELRIAWQLAFLMVGILNLLLIGIGIYCVSHLQKNLYFPLTQKQLFAQRITSEKENE